LSGFEGNYSVREKEGESFLTLPHPNPLSGVGFVDTVMYESSDLDLLTWLAEEERILITHDLKAMPGFVADRIHADLMTPSVIIVKRKTPIGL
jgi:hypothetical protein